MWVFPLLQERLTRLVSISLVGNPNLEDPNNSKRKEIIDLCKEVSTFDPEFICKVLFDIYFFPKPSCLIFSRLLLFLSLSPLNSFSTIWSGNHLPLGFVRARFSSALRRFSSSSTRNSFESFLLWLLKKKAAQWLKLGLKVSFYLFTTLRAFIVFFMKNASQILFLPWKFFWILLNCYFFQSMFIYQKQFCCFCFIHLNSLADFIKYFFDFLTKQLQRIQKNL